eukprot:TRINITY_DN12279_c0_g1_i1.p1 TRINITY_DN12279_c0_g1~~TRINITY_DN12279_c0_g1_i1.p1  ORF type:complete len:386 (-),score=73.65 TRINITY_DN12279_c0_g1_i1:23-1180(-)
MLKAFLVCMCLGLTILYSYLVLDIFGPDMAQISKKLEKELSDLDEISLSPMEKTEEQIRAIRELCGELCDTTKPIVPGEFMGTVTSKVDCHTLFSSPVFHQPALLPPQAWPQLSKKIQDQYTYQGRVEVREWFFNDAAAGGGMDSPYTFTEDMVQHYIDRWLAGDPDDWYHIYNSSGMIGAAADYQNVAGKTLLVIGSQTPWLEAVLLSKKAKKVVTLEYGYFISEYPGHTFMRPDEFRERFLNGTLDTFDGIYSYSSLEHSGIGRYGDTMNPWGDIMAVAEAWCVSTKDAHLVIGVPAMVNWGNGTGKDIHEWNAHTVYGPVKYPFLVTNWKFVYPTRESERNNPDGQGQYDQPLVHAGEYGNRLGVEWQPVFVFVKNNVGLWG